MEVTPLVSALARLLGDVVTFKFMAHAAHWNVTGPSFPQLHELFGAIYDDADDSVDPIAENIRKVGALPPSSLGEFIACRSLDDAPATTSDTANLQAVAAGNDAILVSLQVAYDAAVGANEQGIANFLAERLDTHEKWRWQLRATLGQGATPAPAPRRVTPVDAVTQRVMDTFNA